MKKTFYKYIFEFIVIVFGISISFFLENLRVERENENKEKLVKHNLLNELSNSGNYLNSREKAYNVDLKFLNALINTEINIDSLYKIGLKGVGYYNSICFYRTFDPPNSIYSSLVSDGEINLIKETGLKNLLYRIYILSPKYMQVQIEGDKNAADNLELYLIKNYPQIYNKDLQVNDNIFLLKELRTIVTNDEVLLALIRRKKFRMEGKLSVFKQYLNLKDLLIEQLKI
tara:strand:+ start:140 stop:826 length:687 start_codon:yes stop_codon:yes gene_type:complete